MSERRLSLRLIWPVMGWMWALALQAGAAPIFPIEQVAPGLWGEGRTVVEGSRVETFDVEFLGVLAGAGPAGDLILVRVHGEAMERSGGVAAGMSGSPVYLDGRIVGAIGYGFEMADHSLALVTPIEDMLDVLRRVQADHRPPAAAQSAAPESGPGPGGPPIEAVAVLPGGGTGELPSLPDGVAAAAPLRTPVIVKGGGRRAWQALERVLQSGPLWPVQGGGADSGGPSPDPEPGSAIGIQLMRGDMEITALGTLTYIDDGAFVALGHPLFQWGEVDLFATGAHIHATVQSQAFPFKLGGALAPYGRLTQDRAAAVGGRFDEGPAVLHLSVDVLDQDAGRRGRFAVEIPRTGRMTPILASIAALEGIDRGIDRIGPGTASVRLRIEGEDLPFPFERENLFYSDADIAAWSVSELAFLLQEILDNEFTEVALSGLSLEVEIEEGRRTARIEEAAPARRVVHPGEEVEVEVTLRPFRREPETLKLFLPVPEKALPGELSVEVRRGGAADYYLIDPDSALSAAPLPPPSEGADPEASEDGAPPVPSSAADDLERFLEKLLNRERNQDIVAEYWPETAQTDEEAEESEGTGPFHPWAEPEPVRAVQSTPYVIEGSARFSLRIADPEAEDGGGEEGFEEEPLDGGEAEKRPGMPAMAPSVGFEGMQKSGAPSNGADAERTGVRMGRASR